MADRAAWLQQRRRRYLARILTDFERYIEPLLPDPTNEGVARFKGSVRAKLNALAVDAIDVYTESERGVQINAHAQELKDRQG
jgi:hypothetical protein